MYLAVGSRLKESPKYTHRVQLSKRPSNLRFLRHPVCSPRSLSPLTAFRHVSPGRDLDIGHPSRSKSHKNLDGLIRETLHTQIKEGRNNATLIMKNPIFFMCGTTSFLVLLSLFSTWIISLRFLLKMGMRGNSEASLRSADELPQSGSSGKS